MTTHAPWSPAIERMLARAQDTATTTGDARGAILHNAPGPREIAIETARHLARRPYSPTLKLVPLGTQAEEGTHTTALEAARRLPSAREGGKVGPERSRLLDGHLYGDTQPADFSMINRRCDRLRLFRWLKQPP